MTVDEMEQAIKLLTGIAAAHGKSLDIHKEVLFKLQSQLSMALEIIKVFDKELTFCKEKLLLLGIKQ